MQTWPSSHHMAQSLSENVDFLKVIACMMHITRDSLFEISVANRSVSCRIARGFRTLLLFHYHEVCKRDTCTM